MLPTPSTDHVGPAVYEPAEDSFLFLDTLSSASETAWLRPRFGGRANNDHRCSSSCVNRNNTTASPASPSAAAAAVAPSSPSSLSPPPLILEVGSGSGVVLAFVAAHARSILGRPDVLALATDVNAEACDAARETVAREVAERRGEWARLMEEKQRKNDKEKNKVEGRGGDGNGTTDTDSQTGHSDDNDDDDENNPDKPSSPVLLASLTADLAAPLRPGSVDLLLFNPPYVPTEEVPDLPPLLPSGAEEKPCAEGQPLPLQSQPQPQPPQPTAQHHHPYPSAYARESHLLALAYAGGPDGMTTTVRLLSQLPSLLSPCGVAYVLLCAQNRPAEVVARVREGGGAYGWGQGKEEKGGGLRGQGEKEESSRWRAEIVGGSGKTAGWERLVIVRIWRETIAHD